MSMQTNFGKQKKKKKILTKGVAALARVPSFKIPHGHQNFYHKIPANPKISIIRFRSMKSHIQRNFVVGSPYKQQKWHKSMSTLTQKNKKERK